MKRSIQYRDTDSDAARYMMAKLRDGSRLTKYAWILYVFLFIDLFEIDIKPKNVSVFFNFLFV